MATEIQLPENMTIHHIEGQHNALAKAINEADNEITIQADKLETIDTSGLQSLAVLSNLAKESNKTIQWSGVSKTLSTNAQKIGINQAINF